MISVLKLSYDFSSKSFLVNVTPVLHRRLGTLCKPDRTNMTLYCISYHKESIQIKQKRRMSCVIIRILKVYNSLTFLGHRNVLLNFLHFCAVEHYFLIKHFLMKNTCKRPHPIFRQMWPCTPQAEFLSDTPV